MKLAFLLPGIALLTAGVFRAPVASQAETTLVVAGDFLGSLSPCGCTKPMVGGIRRWATAISTLRKQGDCVIAVNGGLVDGTSRQDELKAESLAESFNDVKASAINLTTREAKLGRGLVASINRLSGGLLTTASLEPSETFDAAPYREAGPFLIGGVDPNSKIMASMLEATDTDLERAVDDFVEAARASDKAPVLLFAGDEDGARSIARHAPGLKAIVFRSAMPNSGPPLKEGGTVLLTPGEKGRELVTATWNGSEFVRFQVVTLGPEIEDDPEVSTSYSHYLERVDDEQLLEAVPRTVTAEYAGNEACISCHEAAAKVWETSDHHRALKTLEDDHHGKDPDCVGCHVVGLGSSSGYMNRATTPQLTDVGCESCHGPAKLHAMEPSKNPLSKAGPEACAKCHDRDHSPKFDFSTYWPKIRH